MNKIRKLLKVIWKHLHELQKQDKLPTEHDTQYLSNNKLGLTITKGKILLDL